ncbi:hypothetical protein GK047_04865 [Paenibacillus sp. SYP-B3998]|uniref:Uncharacterized protein n=1 Tax=Paenibacillus sp. SYP-B3998 TaxID=2678564 RepID=A0A6G3ZVA3_9BACL|nr:hypothetical protein [Paenibacillus sp. SYP-B3998]NEW05347.1 hypothetical protein [Paenibacillus sp. SYP-B3998]
MSRAWNAPIGSCCSVDWQQPVPLVPSRNTPSFEGDTGEVELISDISVEQELHNV